MMCLSLPKSLPGVYQHYLMSFNSVSFDKYVYKHGTIKNLIYLLHTVALDRFFKNVTVISYNILNLSFIKNKIKNEKRLS